MSLRAIIIASLALTSSLTGFAQVILPAPRAFNQTFPGSSISTSSTIITNRPFVPGERPMVIRQNNIIQSRPFRTPNPLTPTATHPMVPNTIWQSPVPLQPIR